MLVKCLMGGFTTLLETKADPSSKTPRDDVIPSGARDLLFLCLGKVYSETLHQALQSLSLRYEYS